VERGEHEGWLGGGCPALGTTMQQAPPAANARTSRGGFRWKGRTKLSAELSVSYRGVAKHAVV
jgi:hypothetical protein